MKKEESSIKDKVIAGSVWMIFLKIFILGIGLISTIILARVLSPEDYGMVAIAMSMYFLLEMMAAFGFDTMLVQKTTLIKKDYDSAWTARFIIYSILAVLFALSAPYVKDFYNKEGVDTVVYALSIQMFLAGLENIAIVDFRRNFEFSKEFKLNVYVKLIGFCITIPLAFYLENYWALIIGSICLKIATVYLGYYFRPYIPSICFTEIKDIMNFSKWILLMNFTQYLRKQAPNLILGRYSSVEAVGVYSLSAELSRLSTQGLVAAMNRSVYSGYAKCSGDYSELFNSFLKVLGVQSLLILPIGFTVSALSEHIVMVILGDKWLAVIYPLSVMAISTAVVSISSSIQYVYFAINKPKMSFIIAATGLIIFLPQAYVFGTNDGVAGIALANIVTVFIMAIISFILISYFLSGSLLRIISQIIRPIFSSMVVFLLLSVYLEPIVSQMTTSSFLALFFLAPSAVISYVVLVLTLWFLSGKPDSSELILIETLKSFVYKLQKKMLRPSK